MATNSLLRLSICALLPGAALAQEPGDQHWDVRAAVYGFFPDIAGTTRFPAPGGEVDIDARDLIRNTELAGMASIEAQKGRIGLFADAIYMDVGDELVGATTLGQGAIPLPPGVTADASLDIEASVWSVAANFRVLNAERSMLDAFAGARLLAATVTLAATLDSPLGPIAAINGERSNDLADAVIGVKGKVSFGEGDRWFVPFYVDVGAGDSDRTSQAATGIGFSTSWGEVFGTYRYLDYDLKADSPIADLELRGPAIGVAYRF